MFAKLLLIILSVFIIWQLFGYLRANPEAISKDKLSRSFFTLGILGLMLIAFVAGLVFWVK